MTLDFGRCRAYLKDFNFRSLFIEELGWDRYTSTLDVATENEKFTLTGIAEKHGLVVFTCPAQDKGNFPNYATRRKIEAQVAKSAFEHIIIYTDAAKTTQVWQWVRRELGKPAACREHTYNIRQLGEALIQKLEAIVFSLEEEESLTTVAVAGRVRVAFDVERVTKRFYDRFKTEHAQFLKFIQGIPDEEMKRWYASVMINRLMFIYFIQKKGFLNNDRDYLRTKLQESKKRGKDLYYSGFLSPLFFKGFAEKQRSETTETLLGKVPYLNGGLFLKHQIEEQHGKTIEIRDSAFEKVFDFFDAYQWHLDERPLRRDNEINPDVLGYIFEKYINQKQMGAYYTKEDITEYISKNTVIPFLFERARQKCKIAFEGEHSIWQQLRSDPDRYIYKAVRHGITWDIREDKPLEKSPELPPEIVEGLDMSKPNLSERPKAWNKPAPPEYALPTEIWLEVVARRNRYQDIRSKLAAGEVRDINDLITYNLDIRQFAQDVLENSEGPDLLNAFWHATEKVTVLDPACGSGAFLFAALNVLEPLYEACLDRMDVFLDEWGEQGKKLHPNYHKLFSGVRARLEKHPNRRYFVLKSIIINNLFGVDIMEEATEICKLRLFLKLVAQIEREEQIEPLPDIDFNILAGNTLVGYATYVDVEKAVGGKLDFEDAMRGIEEKAQDIDRLFAMFRQQQTELGGEVTAEDKKELRKHLKVLEDELNEHLSNQYGVKSIRSSHYRSWLHSHKPFHWFIEFHALMKDGGFDVIIGNPPYISAAKVRREYKLKNYITESCTDIYANFLERGSSVLKPNGHSGMILPLSLTFSGDFSVLRSLIYRSYASNWFSSFARIPAALFSADVRVRNTIHLGRKDGDEVHVMTTNLHRWFEDARPYLFQGLVYAPFTPTLHNGLIPKIGNARLLCAFEKNFAKTNRTVANCFSSLLAEYPLYFKKSAYNWLCFCKELPPCYDGDGRKIPHTKFGTILFSSAQARDLAFLFLNGKIMFLHWCSIGDDFDLTKWMFADFHIDLCNLAPSAQQSLKALVPKLEQKMKENVSFKLNAGKRVGNYNLAKCRSVTDQSDQLFASAIDMKDLWCEIELMYRQMVKTSFDADEIFEPEEVEV